MMDCKLKLNVKVAPGELWHESVVENLIDALVYHLKEYTFPKLIKQSSFENGLWKTEEAIEVTIGVADLKDSRKK